ncbi:MAG: hypothetical protein V4725_07730 [Bacteroidota bacterium]|nr:hypothetical protein [Ferruginibacter sp.]
MDSQKKIISPLIGLFVVLSGFLVVLKALLSRWGIDNGILIIANILFFVVSLLVFFMQRKALYHTNPNVFVRSVMAGMLIKMGVCVFAVILYRLVAGKDVSKISVFAAMFIYLLYLGVEVAVITKLNKQKNV